jgi:hypothetical protein
MADNSKLEIHHLDDKNIAYLTGEFITFESATENDDQLM